MSAPEGLYHLTSCLPFYQDWFWKGRSGLRASKGGDHVSALRLWQPLAQNGDPEAQFQIGLLYEAGLGVAPDREETVSWVLKAALQGHCRAVIWLKRAARQGMPHAQYGLGYIYRRGTGVGKSHQRARKPLESAANQGLADAQVELGGMHVEGFLYNRFGRVMFGIPKPNLPTAIRWFKMAADQGNARGKYHLCLCYGMAAEQADAEGQYDRGSYDEPEFGVAHDRELAFRLCHEAAEQGLPEAQIFLAEYYWTGWPGYAVRRDRAKSAKWFKKATRQINSNSQSNICQMLANAHIQGSCAEPDLAKGYYWTAVAWRDDSSKRKSELKRLSKKMDASEIRLAQQLIDSDGTLRLKRQFRIP